MPISLPARRLRCPACGWHKTLGPRGDVLVAGVNHFDACPQCGDKALEEHEIGEPLHSCIAPLLGALEKWFRR